ncbi:MAG: DedA family protein [Dehalococcoidia bacterium]|nr:DedA family protein [Dehalococcoidia bacterium]
MAGLEQVILNFVQHVYQAMGWPGVVLLMAIESACIPVPSEVIMPLAGWMLIKEPGLSPWYVFLAAAAGGVGNTLGSVVAYAVGRSGGRKLVEKYGKYVLISAHDLHLADAWFNRYGQRAAFISRLLPVVRTFISLPAGIARTPLWKFVVFTFAGSFIWSGALAYGGYLLGQHWERIRSVMRPFDIPLIAIILALVVWFIVRRVKARNANR